MLASKVVFFACVSRGSFENHWESSMGRGVFYLALEESALCTWMCSKIVSRWTKTLPPFCFPFPMHQ